MVGLARANVPGAVFHQADIADLRPGGPRDLGVFDAVASFFSLLMLPRAEIAQALSAIRHLLVPGGLFVLSMVEADVDYVPIPFLGQSIRVSGYPRDVLRTVVEAARFEVLAESARSYAPAGAPPEEHLFLRCRRLG
jgi:hypothetical protein